MVASTPTPPANHSGGSVIPCNRQPSALGWLQHRTVVAGRFRSSGVFPIELVRTATVTPDQAGVRVPTLLEWVAVARNTFGRSLRPGPIPHPA